MVIQIKKDSHFIFGCLVTLLIALLFVRYVISVDIPRIILTAIIILIAAIGDRDEILAISLCCIPLHEAVDFYIAIAMCTAIFALKAIRSIKVGTAVILCMVMVCWELLHSFLPGFNFSLLLTSLIPLLFLMAIVSSDMSEIDYPFIVRAVAIAAVAIDSACLLNAVVNANFNLALAISNIQRLGFASDESVLLGGVIQPNTLGIISVLLVTALLQLRSMGRQQKKDYLLITLLLVFGVLTASRTFLLCLLVMVLLLIVGQKGTVLKKLQFFAILLLVCAIVLLLVNVFFPSVLKYYIGRFQVEDITTGRGALMTIYHRYIVENTDIMLFGVGLNNFSEKVVNIYNIAENTAHNAIQEIIVAWGIPGLIMIALLLFSMLMNARSYNRYPKVLNFIPLIIILVKSMAGQLLTSGYTIVALAFAYIILCQDFSKTEEQQTGCNLVSEEADLQ